MEKNKHDRALAEIDINKPRPLKSMTLKAYLSNRNGIVHQASPRILNRRSETTIHQASDILKSFSSPKS